MKMSHLEKTIDKLRYVSVGNLENLIRLYSQTYSRRYQLHYNNIKVGGQDFITSLNNITYLNDWSCSEEITIRNTTNGDKEIAIEVDEIKGVLRGATNWVTRMRRWNESYFLNRVLSFRESYRCHYNSIAKEWGLEEWKHFLDGLCCLHNKNYWSYKNYQFYAEIDPIPETDEGFGWFICSFKRRLNGIFIKFYPLVEIEGILGKMGIDSLDSCAPYNARLDYLMEQLL